MHTNSITPTEADRLRALLAERGERALLERFNISRTALLRAMSLLPIHPGTRALIEIGLARLE